MGFVSVGLTFTQWPQGSLKEKPVIPELRLSKESRYVIRVGNMTAGSFQSLMEIDPCSNLLLSPSFSEAVCDISQ